MESHYFLKIIKDIIMSEKRVPYKYSYEELQEKYKDNEFWDNLNDAMLMIDHMIELLRLGDIEIVEKKK